MSATLRLLRTVLAASLALLSPLSGQSPAPLTRPQVGAYYDHVLPEQDPGPLVVGSNWSTVQAFPNLTFINPVGILPIPGTNKLVVLEREGRLWSFDNDPATSTKTLALDLSSQCQGWDDSGLLALAFHPDFANNHQIFIWYTWRGGLANGVGDMGPIVGSSTVRAPTLTPNRDRLSRFVLDQNFQTTLATETILLDQKAKSLWHNGCGMFFHPDNGFLYLTDGDDSSNGGAGIYDNSGNPQKITRNLFSCVMRIDVDKRGGAISHAPPARGDQDVTPDWPAYYVPNDNPFVGVTDAREEIFALGLRNPFRMTIDPPTRRIFIGDVGGGDFEELNIIEPTDPYGLNFQWNLVEGGNGSTSVTYGVSRQPALFYSHASLPGACIVGGYVYRGAAFPELYGKYLFGDAVSGQVWYLDESTATRKQVPLAVLPQGPGPSTGGGYRGLSSFGFDAAGELYICQMSSVEGHIFKLQRGGSAPLPPLPPVLSAAGIFTDMTSLALSPRLTPYDINVPFFSDGAVKSRFAAIPTGTTIGFTPSGDWDFPVGSVFVKHFELPVSDLDPSKRRRLETRVLVVKADHTVYGATYRWRDDQKDADLLSSSRTDTIPVETSTFGSLTGVDVGTPGTPGTTVQQGSQITLSTAKGNFADGADALQFAHQLRSGDFDISVRLASLADSDGSGFAGLMARESLEPGSPMVAITGQIYSSSNGGSSRFNSTARPSYGGQKNQLSSATTNGSQTWMRLQRHGDEFVCYSSTDGVSWSEASRTTIEMTHQIDFGLFTATSGIRGTTATFETGVRNQNWYFPSRQDCVSCHNPQTNGVLGMSTRQMNRDTTFAGGVVANQLAAWNHAGYFHDGPADTDVTQLEKLVRADDFSASLELRVRSYLDANCSNCHRPGGVQANWDARFQTPFAQQGILNGALFNPMGNPSNHVITPGSVVNSMIYSRTSVTGANQMPPVGRKTVDVQDVALLSEWINSLPSDPQSNGIYSLTATAEDPSPDATWIFVRLDWAGAQINGATLSLERSLDGAYFVPIYTPSYSGDVNYSDAGAEAFSHLWYRLVVRKNGVVVGYSNIAQVETSGPRPAPEISISSVGQVIPDHSFDAAAREITSFGALSLGDSATRTYRVTNSGTLPLHLNGTPVVRLIGQAAADFVVTSPLSSTAIAPGGTADFTISFTPRTNGVKLAIVSLQCDDPDEAATDFAITGECRADDLAGWWKFDETSGNIAADSSGGSHPASIGLVPALWSANGADRGALAVTGSSGDGIVIPSVPALNPASSFTISLWAKAGDWQNGRTLFAKGNYRLGVEGGQLVCRVGSTSLVSAPLPARHTWVHLAAVFGPAQSALYVNGSQAGTASHTLIPADASGDLVLGAPALAASAETHFNGWIDDARFYRSALDGARIASMASATTTVTLIGNGAYSLRKDYWSSISLSAVRTGPTSRSLPIRLNLTGTAVAGSDYNPFYEDPNTDLQSFVIPQGKTSATFTIFPYQNPVITGPQEIIASLEDGPDYRTGTPSLVRIDLQDTHYHNWKIAAFGGISQAQAPSAADDADPDGDGMSNLMEAALGGNPLLPDSSRQPRIAIENYDGHSYLTATYVRPDQNNNPGLTYTEFWSQDFYWWNTCRYFPGYPVDNGDGTITVKFYSGFTVDQSPSLFLKLQVDGAY